MLFSKYIDVLHGAKSPTVVIFLFLLLESPAPKHARSVVKLPGYPIVKLCQVGVVVPSVAEPYI